LIAILTQYLLPFLALAVLMALIALRIHWRGGPAILFLIFIAIAFGPSLVYALIADASSTALFGGSLIAALAVTGGLALQYRRSVKK